MKFGRNIQQTLKQSLHVSVFMYVCFFINFLLYRFKVGAFLGHSVFL